MLCLSTFHYIILFLSARATHAELNWSFFQTKLSEKFTELEGRRLTLSGVHFWVCLKQCFFQREREREGQREREGGGERERGEREREREREREINVSSATFPRSKRLREKKVLHFRSKTIFPQISVKTDMFAEKISHPYLTDKNPLFLHTQSYDDALKRTAKSVYTIAYMSISVSSLLSRHLATPGTRLGPRGKKTHVQSENSR